MKQIEGLSYKDRDKLYDLLITDSNFKYDISEGAFYTNDDVFVGIYRSPYYCCLYALSETGEQHINKWHDYILKKWNSSTTATTK